MFNMCFQNRNILNEEFEDNMKINKKNSKRIILNDKYTYINDDEYTLSLLLEQYESHKNYVIKRRETMDKLNIKFRMPSIPEDISENIIKFILRNHYNDVSTWNCKSGDLYSTKNGQQECKSFTSSGPISFSPISHWDEIYFLDATKWFDGNFKLYKVKLKKNSDEWKSIKINKKQTFYEQTLQRRRPRLTWKKLYEQINTNCQLIFNKNIYQI